MRIRVWVAAGLILGAVVGFPAAVADPTCPTKVGETPTAGSVRYLNETAGAWIAAQMIDASWKWGTTEGPDGWDTGIRCGSYGTYDCIKVFTDADSCTPAQDGATGEAVGQYYRFKAIGEYYQADRFDFTMTTTGLAQHFTNPYIEWEWEFTHSCKSSKGPHGNHHMPRGDETCEQIGGIPDPPEPWGCPPFPCTASVTVGSITTNLVIDSSAVGSATPSSSSPTTSSAGATPPGVLVAVGVAVLGTDSCSFSQDITMNSGLRTDDITSPLYTPTVALTVTSNCEVWARAYWYS